MATESTKVSIKSLNGTNYATWKIQCRMALIKDGLWGIYNDTEDTPNNEREIPKFMLRRDRALATIVLSMEPTLHTCLDRILKIPLRFGRSWQTSSRRKME